MKLFQLCAEQISLHEPLPWNVRNESGQLLLSKGFRLADAAQLNSLIERGVYVDQEAYESQLAARPRPGASILWADINQRVETLLAQPLGHAQFSEGVSEVSSDIQHTVSDDIDAGMFEVFNQDAKSYAVAHTVQTAFVACLTADRFGLSAGERQTLSNAAITMNVAMLEMQNTLSTQTLPLTPQQRAVVAGHSAQSRDLLERAGVRDADWLRTVEQHHITTDGRGLPADRSQLGDLACMIHYSDVYLAKISARAYRPAMAAHVAARDLFTKSGGAQNPYATAIIKEIGIYPPGSGVKLANGDTAMVVRRGEQAHAPEVHSLIALNGQPYTEPLPRDTRQAAFKVVDAIPRGQVKLALQRSAASSA
jgi:HD-GYP domain-containing protein (c-di-GMP phosphodiesterase class II)